MLPCGIGRQNEVPARQRRVPAQRDLDCRREPAQLVIRVADRGHQESGLGKVMLGRDLLQQRVVEPGVQWHHRGRVAAERPVGEGIDLRKGQAHRLGLHRLRPVVMAARIDMNENLRSRKGGGNVRLYRVDDVVRAGNGHVGRQPNVELDKIGNA